MNSDKVRCLFLKDPSDQRVGNRFEGGQGERHEDELANYTITVEIRREKLCFAFSNYYHLVKRADPVQQKRGLPLLRLSMNLAI